MTVSGDRQGGEGIAARASLQAVPKTTALLALVIFLAPACAVRSVYVKPDFERTDRLNLKRIVVMATPLSDTPAQAAALLARIARRFVQQHTDYLSMRDGVLRQARSWRQACKEGLQGVVRVMVAAMGLDGEDLTLDMVADLQRCDSGALVWRVVLRQSSKMRDPDLARLAEIYGREYGEVAERYAAPMFVAVKTAFQSLPSPTLTDEETLEKISMEE